MGRGKEGNVLRGENELPSHWPANANRRGHSSVKKRKERANKRSSGILFPKSRKLNKIYPGARGDGPLFFSLYLFLAATTGLRVSRRFLGPSPLGLSSCPVRLSSS